MEFVFSTHLLRYSLCPQDGMDTPVLSNVAPLLCRRCGSGDTMAHDFVATAAHRGTLSGCTSQTSRTDVTSSSDTVCRREAFEKGSRMLIGMTKEKSCGSTALEVSFPYPQMCLRLSQTRTTADLPHVSASFSWSEKRSLFIHAGTFYIRHVDTKEC